MFPNNPYISPPYGWRNAGLDLSGGLCSPRCVPPKKREHTVSFTLVGLDLHRTNAQFALHAMHGASSRLLGHRPWTF